MQCSHGVSGCVPSRCCVAQSTLSIALSTAFRYLDEGKHPLGLCFPGLEVGCLVRALDYSRIVSELLVEDQVSSFVDENSTSVGSSRNRRRKAAFRTPNENILVVGWVLMVRLTSWIVSNEEH